MEPLNPEKSYVMIKPDGVQRGLVGRIIQRFEDKGMVLLGLKMILASNSTLEEHYSELKERPFFGALMAYVRLICLPIHLKGQLEKWLDHIVKIGPFHHQEPIPDSVVQGDTAGLRPGLG